MLRLWRGKLWILLAGALGLLAAIIYLQRQPFLYTATMKVTAAPSSQNPTSSRLGGLSSLASLASVSLPSAGGASPFDIYLVMLTSEDIARQIASDQSIMRAIFLSEWNSQSRLWQEPPLGLKARLVRSAKQVLGLPVLTWSKPDHRRLAGFLADAISIQRDAKSPIVTITLDHKNPTFAARLLQRVSTEADRLIRYRGLARSRDYAEHIERKLQTVTVHDQRAALIDVLSEQEKAIMLASSSTPYAANIVSGPTVSMLPTKPKGMIVLMVGTILGVLLGSFFALVDLAAVRAALSTG